MREGYAYRASDVLLSALHHGAVSLHTDMNDRVVGIFDDLAEAEKAASDLSASGVEPERVTVKRVLQPGHRGFSDSETVHALIHAPVIREGDTASQDAGTVILVVEMVDRPEGGQQPDTDRLDSYDNSAVMKALEKLGATETDVVEATPGLDL